MMTISRADVAWQILAVAEDRGARMPRIRVIADGLAADDLLDSVGGCGGRSW
jgi:hypothetical protein